MQNDSSNTTQTDNPQNAGTSNNANSGSDFQETIPSDVLNNTSQDLGFENTSTQSNGQLGSSVDLTPWLIGLGLIVVLVGLVVIVRQYLSDISEPEVAPAATKSAAAKKPAATKKKSTKSKSGKPVKRSKKSSSKRR